MQGALKESADLFLDLNEIRAKIAKDQYPPAAPSPRESYAPERIPASSFTA